MRQKLSIAWTTGRFLKSLWIELRPWFLLELLCSGMPLRKLVRDGGLLYRTTFSLQMVFDRVESCHPCFLTFIWTVWVNLFVTHKLAVILVASWSIIWCMRMTWSSSVRLLKVYHPFLIYVMCMVRTMTSYLTMTKQSVCIFLRVIVIIWICQLLFLMGFGWHLYAPIHIWEL